MEAQIAAVIDRIDRMGGMIPAVESGVIQREIAQEAFRQQRRLDSGEKAVVGVNRFAKKEEPQLDLYEPDPGIRERQVARLAEVKRRRDAAAVSATLDALKRTASSSENVMPALIACAKAYCTVGEINSVFLDVFGRFKEPVTI
jgi:methylmalonyl-CoA mutase N-terminal domain/subunit